MRTKARNISRRFAGLVCGSPGVIFILGLQFLWWITTPFYTVPMWVLYGVVVLCLIIIAAVYAIVRGMYDEPGVVELIPIVTYRRFDERTVLIARFRSYLQIEMVVSIVYVDPNANVETVVGIGHVETVPDGKKAQVTVDREIYALVNGLEDRSVQPRDIYIRASVNYSHLS